MQPLGDLPGGNFHSEGLDVSGDGSVVVGYSSHSTSSNQAFRWTEATGMQGLGFLPGPVEGYSEAHAVSADGSVIVGSSEEAFVWDAGHGMGSLRDVLDRAGADVSGWRLGSAYAISADGLAIAGSGLNPSGQTEAWVAVFAEPIPPQCADAIDNDGDGLVDYPDDPGCPSPSAAPENPQCDDGVDNDGDGLVDLEDPLCGDPAWPYWEARPACGLGVELVAGIPLATWIHRRRKRGTA
jgi:probable HAF family extracellular repeat protein